MDTKKYGGKSFRWNKSNCKWFGTKPPALRECGSWMKIQQADLADHRPAIGVLLPSVAPYRGCLQWATKHASEWDFNTSNIRVTSIWKAEWWCGRADRNKKKGPRANLARTVFVTTDFFTRARKDIRRFWLRALCGMFLPQGAMFASRVSVRKHTQVI